MAGRRAEASVVAQTRERKVEHAFAGKRIGMLQEVKRDKAPVDSADSQVFGEMVLKLIATLSRRQPEPVRSS